MTLCSYNRIYNNRTERKRDQRNSRSNQDSLAGRDRRKSRDSQDSLRSQGSRDSQSRRSDQTGRGSRHSSYRAENPVVGCRAGWMRAESWRSSLFK